MKAEACDKAPRAWAIRTIESVCTRVTSGGTPTRKKPVYYEGGAWGWVKTQELQDRWIEQTEEQITDEAIRDSSAKILPAKTILLALYGATVGQLGLLRRPMTCNQACCAMVVDEQRADFRYLYYQLLHHRHQLKQLATGAAQQNLSGALMKGFAFPFPELTEQQAIAAVLGSLDDKIEQNRQTGRKLEALARAVFKAWFVDFEPVKAKAAGATAFPGMPAETFASLPKSFANSELGPVPEGWMPGTVGNVGEQRREQVAPDELDGETPYVGLEHMPRRDIALSDWGSAATVTSSKFRFRRGDILFGKLRPYFHKVGPAPLDGVCSTDIVVLYPKQPKYAAWLLMLVSSDDFVAHTDRSSAGTKMPRTNWKDMAAFGQAVPPPHFALAFQEQAGPMLDMITASTHEARRLAALRDYLLPRLLSGRVRVSYADRLVGEQV